eukprot:GILK01005059.1.p1 GENE.GILK01005059.1~~GILK01005059.1.p1  ORF type:complete len:715 (-),score=119.19 GILK01005059.1:104-2248(-)
MVQNWLHRAVDNSLVIYGESLKAVVHGVWFTGSKFANAFSSLLLDLGFVPGYHLERRQRLCRNHRQALTETKSVRTASVDSWWDSDDVVPCSSELEEVKKEPIQRARVKRRSAPVRRSVSSDADKESSTGDTGGSTLKQRADQMQPAVCPGGVRGSALRSGVHIWNHVKVVHMVLRVIVAVWARIVRSLVSVVIPPALLSKMIRSKQQVQAKFQQSRVVDEQKGTIGRGGKCSTGLLEDFQYSLLNYIDHFTQSTRTVVQDLFQHGSHDSIRRSESAAALRKKSLSMGSKKRRTWWSKLAAYVQDLKRGLKVFKPQDIDAQMRLSMQHKYSHLSGYPCQLLQVETADGYLLDLIRIPRPGSKKVCLFIHGLFDTAMGWIASGSTDSMATACFEEGFDVFLGNFRGTGRLAHKDPTCQTYWQFSVNELGTYDINTFVRHVVDIKNKEFNYDPTDPSLQELNFSERRQRRPYRISLCSHSMGGAATLIHLTTSGMQKSDHGLDSAILLSPAGYHRYVKPSVGMVVAMAKLLTSWGVDYFKIPTDWLTAIGGKLLEDMKAYESTRELLFSLFVFFIGGEAMTVPFRRVDFASYTTGGVSAGVLRHGFQAWRSGEFCLYDYGTEQENLARYGVKRPPNLLENYKLIDIPVYFGAGAKDNMIPPENIQMQYEAFAKWHPHLAHLQTFESAGHLDFTMAVSEEVLAWTVNVLQAQHDEDD